MSYPEQLKYKQNKAKRYLKRFGKILPIIGMDNPYHYRNKVQAAFYTSRNGKIISGVTSRAVTTSSESTAAKLRTSLPTKLSSACES